MAYSSVESKAYDSEGSSRTGHSRSIFGGAALAFVALACAWAVCANFFGAATATRPETTTKTRPDLVVIAQPATVVTLRQPETVESIDPDLYDALFDRAYAGGLPPGAFVAEDRAAALELPRSSFSPQDLSRVPPPIRPQIVHVIPVPSPRPFPRVAEVQNPPPYERPRRPSSRPTPPDAPNIFERLFGKPRTAESALSYAAPDGGVSGNGQSLTSGRLGAYDRWTAVYDISAHTVYMPDGTKLEAHSGLGSRLDDPHHVHEKMHGATPPNIYDLEPRERLFHGVRALRLIPVGDGNLFGRTGLLAHSYMLGPNGDSNGCVSFRNYDAFLRAFLNREVKRLVVVGRLS